MNKHYACPKEDQTQRQATTSLSEQPLARMNDHPSCLGEANARDESPHKDNVCTPSDMFSNSNDSISPETDAGRSRHVSAEYVMSSKAVNPKTKHSPLRKAVSDSVHPDSEKAFSLAGVHMVEKVLKKVDREE